MSEETKKDKAIIFFDTETSGLPVEFGIDPIEQSFVWDTAQPVQIAWKRYNLEGRLISTHSHIIKPNGFVIPMSAIETHGISNEFANAFGEDVKSVLELFMSHVKECGLLVAHNMSFDYGVVAATLVRHGFDEKIVADLVAVDKLCTMKTTTGFFKVPSRSRYHSGYKWASLTEAHTILFGKGFEDAHDALGDVNAMIKIYYEMKNKHGFNWQALKNQF